MMLRLQNLIFKTSMRIFMPALMKQMKLDGCFDLDPEKMPEHIRVVDNKADVTIFIFAGLDVLFAGMARFEFGRLLRSLGKDCNFVFVRDIQRSGYHYAPNGERTGLKVYETDVRAAMDQLGAKHNIALGSSSGGGAALFFGTLCDMNHIVVFGPAEPVEVYTDLWMQLKIFGNFKVLLTDPKAYAEVALVSLGATATVLKVTRKGWWPILENYRNASPRPKVTFFYGERCIPDTKSAKIFSEFPEVELRPLPTGRHNSPDVLQQEGKLSQTLTEVIRGAIDASESPATPQGPPSRKE